MFLSLQESFKELEKMKLWSLVYFSKIQTFDSTYIPLVSVRSVPGCPVIISNIDNIETWLWFSNRNANESMFRNVKLYYTQKRVQPRFKVGRPNRAKLQSRAWSARVLRAMPELKGKPVKERGKGLGRAKFRRTSIADPLLKALSKIESQ